MRAGDGKKVLWTSQGNRSYNTALAWSPDGKTLASGPRGQVTFLDAATGESRGIFLPLHKDKGLALSPQGHYRATPDYLRNSLVYIIDTGQGQETLSPDEFDKRFGWSNDPGRAGIAP